MPNYNSYYPATYQYANPYANYQFAQPYVQPQQPAQPLQTAQSSILWVSGDSEAQMYPIAPNNAVTLWSQSEPVVYLKQADASGKPTMKIYDLVERTQSLSSGARQSVEYATKTDLNAVVGTMQSIDTAIASLRSDLDSMKGDVYGIAGKKKPPVRKVDDDVE